ncbi:MarR family winged helix-turn-helix transcriptional regulator [Anaerocolumna xylanovorans]|uniref:DNA-binding transcriptional regulator, MarR family n=1 Tax=Anaerocolumna xylanovorans DSM 12503 TaxID=1121345 RepID=A0A1M7XW43_9FIRM|nr:MarR family transcriptional regulator [Anaerocolumna xylanovorans]SHO42945.1 DNA-binding transcriptional regulator, MarR family [Anaerocolumna xylanovorans DSM 12503]
MKITAMELEQEVYRFADSIKDLLSPEIWENILLDCSKNEMFVLWLLYRQKEANMSQIAEYIHVPLNTATGIIARMEKRALVIRERSTEDKRIVTIQLAEQGMAQMQAAIREFSYYGTQVYEAFTEEEMELFYRMIQKLMEIMRQERKTDTGKPKIKKITIE